LGPLPSPPTGSPKQYDLFGKNQATPKRPALTVT